MKWFRGAIVFAVKNSLKSYVKIKYMITVLLLMLAGIVAGYFLSSHRKLLKINDKLITWAIYGLLFLLGISVGVNKTIIQNLDKIGLQSAIITTGAVTGSVLVLWALYHLFFKAEQTKGAGDEE
jgi:uncharacterized membrane protein YbjE (DUF340 family)